VFRRIVRPFLAASLLALAWATPAAATSFGEPPATPGGAGYDALCAVLYTAGGLPTLTGQPAVTKTVLRSDNANGSTDFKVVLTGAIPAQFSATDALDCLWIDGNNNGVFNAFTETMKGYTVSNLVLGGSGATRTATFEANVPGAAGKTVCDRAYGANMSLVTANLGNSSAILAGQWMLFYSPNVCTGPTNPPVVPDSNLPVILSLTAALTGGAGLLFLRRRAALAAA
jgi:hypothetical protein